MVTETTITDATELSQEKRVELAQRLGRSVNEESGLRHDAKLDRFDSDEVTMTTEWHGESLAEAKGRAFKTRDIIENHTGRSVDVSHTGVGWTFPSTTFYEFTITVEPSQVSSSDE